MSINWMMWRGSPCLRRLLNSRGMQESLAMKLIDKTPSRQKTSYISGPIFAIAGESEGTAHVNYEYL